MATDMVFNFNNHIEVRMYSLKKPSTGIQNSVLLHSLVYTKIILFEYGYKEHIPMKKYFIIMA